MNVQDIPKCPRRYRFMFQEAGTRSAPGFYDSFEDALRGANVVALRDRCGCWLERCRRWTKDGNDKDWYEPHEPNLDRAGFSHERFMTAEQISDRAFLAGEGDS